MYFINKQTIIRAFVFIIVFAFMVSCSPNSTEIPSDGSFIGNVYENNFFKFKIKLPDGWYTVSEETAKAMSDTGKELIAGDDQNMKASLKAAQKNVYNLFQTFQVAPGTPIHSYNMNITCAAERVSHLPGIKTGEDYLLNVKKLLSSGQVEIAFVEEINNRVIGGKNFYSIKANMSIMGQNVEQEYYAMFHNGIILLFVVNLSGSEQEAIIQEVIGSISFH